MGFSKIPPVGTSAYKAYQAAKRIDLGAQPKPWSFSPTSSSGAPLYTSFLGNTRLSGSPLDDSLSSALGVTKSPSGPVSPSGPERAPSAGVPSTDPASQPQTFDYLDAPWASAYGMSRETAYSEAMENTAYRRSVQDMQKAGLNPAVIFGAGNGYTAGSPAYVSSAPSGSGSGSGSGSRSGSGRGRSNGKLFSSSAYAVMSALGGIVGAASTRSVGGYWLGVSLTQGAMNAMNLLSKR